MPKYYIKACQFCNRPCKGQRGKTLHEQKCKSRPSTVAPTPPVDMGTNYVAPHPRTQMMSAVNKVWNCLSDHEQLYALALLMEKSHQ